MNGRIAGAIGPFDGGNLRMQYQKQMVAAAAAASVVLGVCVAGASGQTLHAADYLLRVTAGQLETGAVGADGQAVFPTRVKSAVFGAEGIPNFTNDPGVDAPLGQLIPGMSVGFDITAALRDWDAVDGFVGISADRLTVRKSGVNTRTPLADALVPGIVFGQANTDAGAGFHHHVQFIFNPAGGGAPDGLWLFEWELWTDAPGVERTEPLWVVFAQGAGVSEIDDAVAWVEANLVSGPCVADLAEPFGTVNFFDLLAYVGLFNAGDLDADLAAPFGVLNFFDLSGFLGAFNAGCP